MTAISTGTAGPTFGGQIVKDAIYPKGCWEMPTARTLRDFLMPATQAAVVFGAFTLVLFGLALPTHDYAGMGDPVLDRLVSRDALVFATFIAGSALTLSIMSIVLFRRQRLVWLGGILTLLSIINLWRCVSYYWLHPDWIGR